MIKYYNEDHIGEVILSGGTEQRNLPEGYTQVEYLQSDGNCYIDLLRVPNNNDIIEEKFQIVSISTGGTHAWYGSMPASNQTTPRIGIGLYSSNKFFCGINNTVDLGTANTNVHTLRFQATGQSEITYTLDGTTAIDSTTTTTDTPIIQLSSYLFARHGNAGVQVYDGNGTKIFYHKEYLADNTLAMNLIPCRRNSDGELGMYDTVSGQFLTNQGTGTLTAGSETVPTPDTPVNIVCNNGVLKLSPNLISGDSWILNTSRTSANGNTYELQGAVTTALFTVESNTTYVACYNGAANMARWYEYTEEQTYIANSYVTDTTTLTTSSNTKYIAISFTGAQIHNVVSQEKYKLCSVNKGSVALPFVPYGQIYVDGTTETVRDSLGNTATAEMLLKVGDYADTQKVIKGEVTRNVGVLVLDGTETWVDMGTIGEDNHRFLLPIDSTTDAASSLCTHFNRIIQTNTTLQTDRPCIRFSLPGSSIQVYTTDNTTTLAEWTQFLAEQYANGTPIIIVYPLATPTTEEVDSQFLDGEVVEQISGAISNLPIEISHIHDLKKRYVTDSNGNATEITKIYKGDTLLWERI